MRRIPDKDCPECFAKACECECKTCLSKRERNSKLTNHELFTLNLASAIETEVNEAME